jgi:hypothetical protein
MMYILARVSQAQETGEAVERKTAVVARLGKD